MAPSDRINALRTAASDLAPSITDLRRKIHALPETGWEELATTALVERELTDVGLSPFVRTDGTGLIVDVGDGDGPLVAFRADLDALPIQELNEVPYVSQVPGKMHACGHDAHTAIAVGIAKMLARQPHLPGRARFIFQPAEEWVPGGARTLRDEGAVEGVTSLIAFHVDPSIPPGIIGLRTGAITGATDRLIVRLSGPGGHTSRPHQTVDLVYAAAKVVTDLPALMRHEIDPRQTALVVFGRVQGGGAANVIPGEVEIAGTVRLFDLDLWHAMPQMIDKLVQAIVSPIGAVAHVDYRQGSPPVINDPMVIDISTDAVRDTLGNAAAMPTHQSLGAEDLAWFLEDIPGALIRLGAAPPGRTVDLHSATFDIDERALEIGMLVGSETLLRLMKR